MMETTGQASAEVKQEIQDRLFKAFEHPDFLRFNPEQRRYIIGNIYPGFDKRTTEQQDRFIEDTLLAQRDPKSFGNVITMPPIQEAAPLPAPPPPSNVRLAGSELPDLAPMRTPYGADGDIAGNTLSMFSPQALGVGALKHSEPIGAMAANLLMGAEGAAPLRSWATPGIAAVTGMGAAVGDLLQRPGATAPLGGGDSLMPFNASGRAFLEGAGAQLIGQAVTGALTKLAAPIGQAATDVAGASRQAFQKWATERGLPAFLPETEGGALGKFSNLALGRGQMDKLRAEVMGGALNHVDNFIESLGFAKPTAQAGIDVGKHIGAMHKVKSAYTIVDQAQKALPADMPMAASNIRQIVIDNMGAGDPVRALSNLNQYYRDAKTRDILNHIVKNDGAVTAGEMDYLSRMFHKGLAKSKDSAQNLFLKSEIGGPLAKAWQQDMDLVFPPGGGASIGQLRTAANAVKTDVASFLENSPVLPRLMAKSGDEKKVKNILELMNPQYENTVVSLRERLTNQELFPHSYNPEMWDKISAITLQNLFEKATKTAENGITFFAPGAFVREFESKAKLLQKVMPEHYEALSNFANVSRFLTDVQGNLARRASNVGFSASALFGTNAAQAAALYSAGHFLPGIGGPVLGVAMAGLPNVAAWTIMGKNAQFLRPYFMRAGLTPIEQMGIEAAGRAATGATLEGIDELRR